MIDGQAAIAFSFLLCWKISDRGNFSRIAVGTHRDKFCGKIRCDRVDTNSERTSLYTFCTENHETVVQTFGRKQSDIQSSLRKQSAVLLPTGIWILSGKLLGEDYSPWWMLDTEKGLTLHYYQRTFPKAAIYHYMIEVSDDNKEWKTVLDRRNGRVVEQRTDITF